MAMAGATGANELQRELVCAICLDFFDDPVILKCGHNFCRFCILMHWEENGGEDVGYQCPECRQIFGKISFTKNYLVKNLVDKLSELDCLRQCKPQKPAEQIKPETRCERHHEELKLFCHTDRKPICVVCRESRAHRHHDVSPIPEVIEDMKADLRMRLIKLNFHRTLCAQVIAADERSKTNVKLKKQELKEKIENEVGELVQFLLDEKDELLASLDTEEYTYVSVIDENLKEVEREMATVDVAISDIQRSLSDSSSFEGISHTTSRPHQALPIQSTDFLPNWEEFKGPLQLILWKKMIHVLKTGPSNLTLDTDTAHPNLVISGHDTAVEEARSRSQEPDLPQKFTRFFGVLSTAEFSSGQHYWEVDVRDKGVWYLGVTTKYSNRKGFVNLSPSAGYWSLCLQDRLYANEEDARLPIAEYWNTPRVGVYLDYDGGRVSFYDAVTMKRVYTFDAYFDDPVCPFFSPGKNNPGSRMHICHYY
ncbi:E3 ubiquitin-protein ligase TRIM47 [Paramormyrops kingsleyae]|uniref:Tripartite motif containing 47 n=1 Tax=Paramormyrops kingsleyae TaxID=1676925 RepID=A0A3B3QJB7_9TELE|nr:zinc-binding protein A33-like [Paramormyrops kingsleyae]